MTPRRWYWYRSWSENFASFPLSLALINGNQSAQRTTPNQNETNTVPINSQQLMTMIMTAYHENCTDIRYYRSGALAQNFFISNLTLIFFLRSQKKRRQSTKTNAVMMTMMIVMITRFFLVKQVNWTKLTGLKCEMQFAITFNQSKM